MLSIAIAFSASADIDLSGLQFSTSAASAGRRLELRDEGTVGHALVSGTEYKGDPNGGAATAWNTASLTTGWQTLTSGTNAAAILKLDSAMTAIEGGRLQSNTTWDSSKTHVVRNWVTVPSGVTLTISHGAIVKFCESAGIKVLSGGKVQVNGAEGADVFFASIGNDTYGGDTNMRDGDFETNSYEIVTLNGGLWSDNGYWVTPDAQLRGYPEVTLHDSLASVSDGVARVPVTVEGTRNAPFSIDWQITGSPFSTTSGTLSWTQSSEGTKYIEIPLKSSYSPSGVETFTVRTTLARSVMRANEAAQVKVFKGGLDVASLQYSTSAASAGRRLELRGEGTVGHALVNGTEYKGDPNGGAATAWNTASLTTGWQTLTSGTNAAAILKLDSQSTAIDGGRLQSNTTWDSSKTHVVRNWVTVPSGVTLTISQGAIVKFCEMAGIKVLSGGKVQINGAEGADVFFASIGNDTYGGDTNLRAGDFETNSYEIVTLNGGTWSDNGYWVTPDAAVRPYPEVALHDAIGAVEGGVVRVPVSVSGIRNAPFSIDWQIAGAPFTSTSGTLTWSQSSEGTKFIEIPINANYSPNGTETFSLSATRARSVNLSNETVRVSVYSGHIAVGDVIENGESTPSAGTEIETRGIGGTMIAKALERITYSPRWSGAASCEVAVDGNRLLSNAIGSGTLAWPRPEAPGLYTFTHKAGGETLTARFAVLGDDTIAIESNRLQSNTIWTAEKTWLVTGELTVPSGVTLTIEPGTVVKFMPGAKLIVEAGGTCIAKGVKFTHAYDDAVGGDTLFDGAVTLPVMEDYEIKGTVTDDDSTEYRYTAPIVLSGTITANTTWRGWKVYNVTGNLTIKSGVTLTVEPGAIVKFNSGVSLTVSSGATLNAIGTRAQPIVFTSIKDDEHGGDTNGDGEKTYAYAGDWYQIKVPGTANFNYCHVLYNSSTENYGAVEAYGGTVTFDNSEIAHTKYECVNAHNSGYFTARNSKFWDSSLGFGYYGSGRVKAYNCVFSDLSVAVRQSGKTLTNCAFYRCLAFTDQNGDGSTYSHCLFFNPADYGAQFYTKCGTNGNIWGDPLFVDAENGDFRLQKGSPCINAGDAASAPEFDYYGQPRDDGAPDIGIYELAGGMSANDLAAVGGPRSVAVAMTIGDTLTVSYDVANVGKQAINGSWRDKVSLVSADGGYSINLGTVVQTATLDVDATNTFNAQFTVPTDAEGTWRVQVGVNVERDIYEGANVTNNVATSEGTIEVSLPARAAADGFSGTATKGAPASAKFALDGAEPMVARINAPAGTIVYLGSGFMPNASSYSARAVVGADGGLIGIPAGVMSAYILVETTSSKGVAFTMTLESAALAVQSVTPATLPYTGTTGLVIDGANFAEGCTVVAWPDGQPTAEVALGAANVVSATRLSVAIDCNRLQSGTSYTLCVADAGGNKSALPHAVTVANVPAAPKLKATLDAPASVRRGRTLTVYIDYENVGNADMPAPIFELISEGQVFKIDGACYTNSVKVMGLSSEAPVGTLRPGEPQRIGIPVTILAENVKWKLRSYHAAQASAKSAKFSLRELYDEDWVLYHVSDDDATIANLRTAIGSTFADYYTNLGAWLGTVEPQTSDYEALKSAFGRYLYLKASEMHDVGDEGNDSSTGGSPVQNLNAQAARSTSAPRLLSDPIRGGDDVILGSEWKAKYPRDGSVWFWDSARGDFVLAVKEIDGVYTPQGTGFDLSKTTYLICHGNQNDLYGGLDKESNKWVKRMAQLLCSQGNVLSVNWGNGADHDLPHFSSLNIGTAADEAVKSLVVLGLNADKTILIGHSHGGHVAARIATSGKFAGKFARYIGLDVSTTDKFVHGTAGEVMKWIKLLKGRCKDEQVEFYKSSWNMSLENKEQLFGKYNFALCRANGDFYELPSFGVTGANKIELARHSYAWQWFIETIADDTAYANLGFNFTGDASWKAICRNNGTNDIGNPGGAALAGMVRGNVVELLSIARAGDKHDGWEYSRIVSPGHEAKEKMSSGSSETLNRLNLNTIKAIDYSIGSGELPAVIASNGSLKFRVVNEADNNSVNYMKINTPSALDNGRFPSYYIGSLPWNNDYHYLANGVWLLDLDGLLAKYPSLSVDDWISMKPDVLNTLVASDASRFVRRIGLTKVSAPNVDNGTDMPFMIPGGGMDCVVKFEKFDNDLFDDDRPLMSIGEDGKTTYRRVLLLVAAGIVANPEFKSIGDFFRSNARKLPEVYASDLYSVNNIMMREVQVIPQDVHAIISKSALAKKSASLRFARLLAATPTHQLSENALKPGEVVQVKADKNGNWSIALDCTESYTTAEDDEIVFNRFELTDAGNEDGAPRFQNNNTVCDVERVTVSGTLPQTTDADGNLVCEGRRYAVQLTVASSDNEDDVTTCVLDVRATKDDDPGEDEDDDHSNEPKSCDPNEMVGDEGVGEKRLVQPGQELTYTIYFENKSDAEAAAACVEVFNPLNEWLDWSSLTMVDVGYNNQVDSGLSGLHEGVSEKTLEGTNTIARTEFKVVYYDGDGNEVDVDEDDGALGERALPDGVTCAQVEWYIRIVDPNGDADGWPLDMENGGLLLPNDDTHRGEGYIRYKVKVRDDAPMNTVITNSATIIFDHFNDPIETDPAWWNTVGRQDWIEVETNLVAGAKGTVTSKTDAKTGVTTLTAKPGNKNSLFAYWVGPEGEKAGFAATLKVKAATQGGKYTAVFTTKTACAKPSVDRSNAFAKGGATMFNSVVGVTASDRFVVPDECYPVKFTATGMPKGLKVNATSGAITGVPTKAGKFTAVVTVASVANAKKKVTVKIPMTIAKLPKWTYGTFTGIVTSGGAMDAFDYPYNYRDDPDTYSDIGSATMSIGASGKISLKVVQGGTNWTASASGFAATSDCEAELYNIRLTAKATVGKKTYTRPFTLMLERQSYYGDENGGPTAAIDSTIFDGRENWYGEIHLQRYFWRDSSEDTAMLAPYAGAYAYYTEDGEKLTLTVAANGVTKVAGALASGRKLSLSTRAVMSGDEPWVPAYAPYATAKVKSGKTTKTVRYGDFYCPVILFDYPSDPEPGSCFAYRNPGVRTPYIEGGGSGTFAYSTAYGQAASNKVVTVTAKPSKDSVFAYWMRGAFVVGYSPQYSVRMAGDDVKDLTAVFRKKSEFKYATLVPWWTDAEGKDLDKGEVANIMKWSLFTGMKTTLRFCIEDDMRPVKFTATGLPKGMKLNALTGVLSGVPTAASSGTAKITVTCTANTTRKVTQSFKWQVRKLRTFARGTFKGTLEIAFREKSGQYWDDELEEFVDTWAVTNAVEKTLTLTVGANGKASGKVISDGKTYVVSTACYSSYSDESSFTDAYDPAGAGKKTWEDETFTAVGTIVCGSMKWPIRLTVREWGDMNPVATKATRATDVNPKGYGAWTLDTLMTIETYGTPTGEGAPATDFLTEGLRRVK